MKKIISHSEDETKKIASSIAQEIESGVIALTGELGSGKTIFVQGFAKGLRIREKIISPTFVLIRQHKLPDGKKTLYHIDLYRLEGKINIKQLGIKEILLNPENLVLIEWAEKIKKDLPEKTIKINIEKKGTTERLITIS